MTRRIALAVLMLAVALQGPIAAFASTSLSMASECRNAPAADSGAAHKDCCPNSPHSTSCCLELCFVGSGSAVSPAHVSWIERPAVDRPRGSIAFSTRGDSPLIRPPIL